MSPMLVVAYAIAGRVDIDMYNEPISYDPNLQPVYLKDLLPTDEELADILHKVLTPDDYKKNYDEIFEGNELWKSLKAPVDKIYKWDVTNLYKGIPFLKAYPKQ